MSKTSRVKGKPQTHFEQVPLTVVKRVASGDDLRTPGAGPDKLTIEKGLRRNITARTRQSPKPRSW
jgi:hypothetical protein